MVDIKGGSRWIRLAVQLIYISRLALITIQSLLITIIVPKTKDATKQKALHYKYLNSNLVVTEDISLGLLLFNKKRKYKIKEKDLFPKKTATQRLLHEVSNSSAKADSRDINEMKETEETQAMIDWLLSSWNENYVCSAFCYTEMELRNCRPLKYCYISVHKVSMNFFYGSLKYLREYPSSKKHQLVVKFF